MAPVEVEEWSLDDVLAMLDGLGLGHLQQPFKENGVNGRLLVTMHEAEFIEVGCTSLPGLPDSYPPAWSTPGWRAIHQRSLPSLLTAATVRANIGRACKALQHSLRAGPWLWVTDSGCARCPGMQQDRLAALPRDAPARGNTSCADEWCAPTLMAPRHGSLSKILPDGLRHGAPRISDSRACKPRTSPCISGTVRSVDSVQTLLPATASGFTAVQQFPLHREPLVLSSWPVVQIPECVQRRGASGAAASEHGQQRRQTGSSSSGGCCGGKGYGAGRCFGGERGAGCSRGRRDEDGRRGRRRCGRGGDCGGGRRVGGGCSGAHAGAHAGRPQALCCGVIRAVHCGSRLHRGGPTHISFQHGPVFHSPVQARTGSDVSSSSVLMPEDSHFRSGRHVTRPRHRSPCRRATCCGRRSVTCRPRRLFSQRTRIWQVRSLMCERHLTCRGGQIGRPAMRRMSCSSNV